MKYYELTYTQVMFMKKLPETGMGYQNVKLVMTNGSIHFVTVINCIKFEANPNIDVNLIKKIILE